MIAHIEMRKLSYIIIRYACLFVFYSCLRFLPASSIIYFRGVRLIRYVCCKHIFKSIGKHVNIEKGAYFGTGESIEIGSYSGIGVNCEIHGPVKIGDNVMMGPEVVIYTYNHNFSRTDIPMRLQNKTIPDPVTISDDVWIGRRSMIMAGVNIGTGAVIAAGAIVTRDVPDFAVVAGVPAKVVKYRRPIHNGSSLFGVGKSHGPFRPYDQSP